MSKHAEAPDARSRNLQKILVELDGEHGYSTETMWAEPVGENRFALRNVPFYAYDLSMADIVSVERKGGVARVNGVAERKGHSTYRIVLRDHLPSEVFIQYWAQLERIGCTYERATDKLLSIDVPPHADIYFVYEVLEAGEANGFWTFEEGHCGHLK